MTDQAPRSQALLRRAGWMSCFFGWIMLISFAAARFVLGAPQSDGALLAGLALAFAFMITGVGLILLDALHAGFGALDSFFVAALARSSERRKETLRQPSSEMRGYIGERPFVANSDGTVTVETLLGPRHFSSLADAQDFIGS